MTRDSIPSNITKMSVSHTGRLKYGCTSIVPLLGCAWDSPILRKCQYRINRYWIVEPTSRSISVKLHIVACTIPRNNRDRQVRPNDGLALEIRGATGVRNVTFMVTFPAMFMMKVDLSDV